MAIRPTDSRESKYKFNFEFKTCNEGPTLFVNQIKRSYTFTDRNVQRKRGISLKGDQGHRVKGSFE